MRLHREAGDAAGSIRIVRFSFATVGERPRPDHALWRAVGLICDLYSTEECRNYSKAAGYAYE